MNTRRAQEGSVSFDVEGDRWKIKKEVSLGDIFAFVMAFSSVIYAYSTLDKRVTIIEEKALAQVARDVRQDEEAAKYQQRIDSQLSVINAKLDRLIERNLK